MTSRSVVRTGGQVLVAVLLNIGLLVAATLLTADHPLVQDISAPQAVSLIRLKETAPELSEPEPEIPEPPKPAPLDFQPELARPSLDGPADLDLHIKLDPTLFSQAPQRGDFIFNGEDLDQPPREVVRTKPVYPYRARQRNIEGSVKVKLLVKADGTVGDITILESDPPGVFDAAVKKMVPQWRFSPGRIDGRAVPAWVVTNVVFSFRKDR